MGDTDIKVVLDTWSIDHPYCTGNDMSSFIGNVILKRGVDCLGGNCEDFYFSLLPEPLTTGICKVSTTNGIGWNTLGQTPSVVPPIGIKTDNSGNAALALAQWWDARAHEFGHNFGFGHTCYRKNKDGTYTEAGCTQVTSSDGKITIPDGTISLKKDDYDPDTYFGFDVFRENITGVVGPSICVPPTMRPRSQAVIMAI